MRKMLIMVIFAMATPVLGDETEIPLEVLVDEADLIVAGKVTRIQEDPFFTIGPRKFDHAVYHDVAVLEVASILKASPQVGKLKEVHIGQPGKKNTASAELRFQPGQQGTWLLTQDPGRNVFWANQGVWLKDPSRHVYWARQPSQFRREKEVKKIADMVEARSKVPGGKPANGLVARAELVEAPGHYQVRFSLKNVSEKPMTVCDYVGNQPVQVNWVGPDGKGLKSKHYQWLKAARIAALDKMNFVVIQPGGVRFIDHKIVFQTPSDKAANFDNVAPIGANRITVSYSSHDDGKKFELENVWTGTVTANELTFSVK